MWDGPFATPLREVGHEKKQIEAGGNALASFCRTWVRGGEGFSRRKSMPSPEAIAPGIPPAPPMI